MVKSANEASLKSCLTLAAMGSAGPLLLSLEIAKQWINRHAIGLHVCNFEAIRRQQCGMADAAA